MLRLTLFSALLLVHFGCAKTENQTAPLPVVETVDLERYMGTWYEVARFPHSFQKKCGASKAVYELREDGRVEVVNSCQLKENSEKVDKAKALAYVEDPQTHAKLKVSFVPFFQQFGWFAGNYWIIALDKEQYQYAMVGTPSRDYLWILSRKPHMRAPVLDKLRKKAKNLGFDVSRLKKSPSWD